MAANRLVTSYKLGERRGLKAAQRTHSSSDVIKGHLCQNVRRSFQQTNQGFI